ncbi:hypothetical protein DL96DRAFT_1703394 [Flagelloscypha sp. PMI_526]|nr:hypothetical protein DL96DRAFT_1703394 [Flagelloscypha sp. PMI_526]
MAEPGTCFSSVVIWRCSALRRTENELLLIGSGLQFFVSFLVFVKARPSNRYHFLLVAEGVFNFLLALLDLLSHVLPAAQVPSTFNTIDNALAASSFHTIGSLPKRFRNLVKILLLLFIPALIALTEISSFIGVSHMSFMPDPSSNRAVPAIGFDTGSTGQVTWSFFTSFALAVLTAFQAIAFSLSFFKLVVVALNQRQIEIAGTDEAALYMGIGWLAAGFKAGASLSRGLLAYGTAKGAPRVEDFRQLIEEMTPGKPVNRRSKLMAAIGGPISSTFHQMSPTATAFHSAKPAHGRSPLASNPPANAPQMREFSTLRDGAGPRARERVTVHFHKDTAPVLEMRFSQLDMPEPDTIVERVKSRPNSVFQKEKLEADPFADQLAANLAAIQPPPPVAKQRGHYATDSVAESINTIAAVHELASQFPRLPRNEGHAYNPFYVIFQLFFRTSLTSPFSNGIFNVATVPGRRRRVWRRRALRIVTNGLKFQSILLQRFKKRLATNDRELGLSSDTSMSSPGTGLSNFSQPANESRPTSYGMDSIPESPQRPRKQQVRSRLTLTIDELAQSVMAEQRGSWATDMPAVPSPVKQATPAHKLHTGHRAPRRTPTVSKNGLMRGSVHLQIQPPPREEWNQGMYEIDYSESPAPDQRHVLRDDEAMAMERY